MNLDPGEVALAVVGISNVIRGEVPRWTLEKAKTAASYPEQIADLARKCVKGQFKAPKLKREHDYRKTLDRLSVPPNVDEIEKLVTQFPIEQHEMAADFIVSMQNTWAHLKEIFPVSEYLTLTGADNVQPTGDKTWQFFYTLSIINDPLVVPRMIGSGAMLRPQAKAVREFFPTISAGIDEEIYAAIAEETAKVQERSKYRKFRLNSFVQAGMESWLDRRSVAYNPDAGKAPPVKPTTDLSESYKSGQSKVALSPTEQITQAGQR